MHRSAASGVTKMASVQTPRLTKNMDTERIFNRKSKLKTNLVFAVAFLLSVKVVYSESISDSENASGRFISDVYKNGTFRTGNVLWDNILNQCTVTPSIECLQKNVYSYFDDSLGMNGDINVTNSVCFKKNNVDVNKYSKEANVIYLKGSSDGESRSFEKDEDNEIDDEDAESETPLEEVTDALYDKGVKFLVTHDMKIQLPEVFFHGATLKLSPRALTKTGALVHVDLEPRVDHVGHGRLFFKKIKKFIKKKLVMAAIAIILVIKLIALKLFFVFPVIFGFTTAKKLVLKLLLFLFPALSHIFKLCSWYHNNYHTTKFHHHHHLITHHHHKQPHSPYGPPHHSHHGSTVIQQGHHDGPPAFEHYPQDWELSGPGLGNEYVAAGIHRNAINNFKPNENDVNDINAWGLGLPPGQSANVGEINVSASVNQPNVVPGNVATGGIVRPYSPGVGRPVGPPPYQRNKKVHGDPLQAEKEALIRAAALAARAPPSPVRDELLKVSRAKLAEAARPAPLADPDTITAEKFYGTLVERVDNILSPMASELGCLERAVCSMYKAPMRHTPYSNLVSNELSKDSNELLPAADSKMALRYYRYVQAARDGQEQKDCMTLYPDCNVDYTK